ncbi:MBL fold metallo-hydrolase [Paracoccaceae bacterium]|nr:MBL fold metallo-hydrolase [Paracoccaceae bacterium]
MKNIEFVFQESPEAGKLYEIIEGVYWFPMPLPMMGPDYVNCYILDDGQEIALVDTGANIGDCKNIWETTLKKHFPKKKISNVYVTHHHPDHIGLAGWLCEKYNTEMICSRTAYLMAKMLSLDVHERVSASTELFWKQAGMSQQMLEEKLRARPFNFGDGVSPLDKGFIRISENEIITINGVDWTVSMGNGHAPEHATFWSKELNMVLAGDQVLPGISSNLGVYPTEPNADTVGDWINSCKKFLELASDEHVVLPGHGRLFSGLPRRLVQLIENHESALKRIKESLEAEPKTAVELFKTIFKRDINKREYMLALHEAVGHVNHLRKTGLVNRHIRQDGAFIFELIR